MENEKNEVETVDIYCLKNYRGQSSYYCLQLPTGYDPGAAECSPYLLPPGWSKVMEGEKCLAIRTSLGELVKFFMAKSKAQPGICLFDGTLHFLKKA